MSCRSSKRWYQHIVAPDGFTLTASFSPIFAFTTSCQLVFFHGNCTGNFQFKLIVAIMITETTVIRTEDSSGKTIGNSNKKKPQKQYDKKNNDTTSKQIKTTSLLNMMLVLNFSACAPTVTLNSSYALHIYYACFFLENAGLVDVFFAVPACTFLQYRKLLDLEKLMFPYKWPLSRLAAFGTYKCLKSFVNSGRPPSFREYV